MQCFSQHDDAMKMKRTAAAGHRGIHVLLWLNKRNVARVLRVLAVYCVCSGTGTGSRARARAVRRRWRGHTGTRWARCRCGGRVCVCTRLCSMACLEPEESFQNLACLAGCFVLHGPTTMHGYCHARVLVLVLIADSCCVHLDMALPAYSSYFYHVPVTATVTVQAGHLISANNP